MKSISDLISRRRFIIWFLPAVVFLFLAGGNIWAWHNSNRLIREMIRDRAGHTAQQMFIRLRLIYYERAKDLTHLATVLKPLTPRARQRFLHDAEGIISRESAFESIGFVDTSGNIELSVPQSPAGLTMLTRSGNDVVPDSADEPVTTEALTIPTEQVVQGIVVPVTGGNGGRAQVTGAVAGMLFLRDLIQSTIAITLPPGFGVDFKVGEYEIFDSPETVFQGPGVKDTRTIMGTEWSVTVYSGMTGETARLREDNLNRLFLNLFASLLASVLLAAAMIAFFRAGENRRRLTVSEERYRRLAENARDMVFRITLPEGRYEYVSPAASELTGYSVEEFYSRPRLLRDIVDPEWTDYYESSFRKLAEGDIKPVYEFRIISKSGEKRWVHLRPVLVKDGGGRPSAVEAIATDITQLKNAMTEREKLIEELEKKNAELERYAYTISHELKTPLITIRGFLGYLEEEAAEGDIRGLHQDLLLIQSATDTMQRLLEGLIELTRVGRAAEGAEDIPFDSIVKDALKKHRAKIDRRGIEIRRDHDMPVVHGNRAELFELVENLLENAVKFMGDQENPSIRLGWYKEDDDVVFYIEDNGIGIDPKYRNRIFGIFTKLDPKSEGAGVGLALAQRIVAYHGGWIRAESAGQGKGLRICFTLPVVGKPNE
ncbi:MAG: sensor histidine kinase [Chitinispirillaceae bacterium]